MALTKSNMLELGTEAPEFSLLDTISGKTLSWEDVAGKKGTLVLFICNHCPYVIHVNEELIRVANDYEEKGVKTVAISSNDVENYPVDGPDNMAAHAKREGYPFPYLYDESQDVAKAYAAACTPDIYLFNEEKKLVYRGRLDDSRPGNETPLSGRDLRSAIENMLAGNDPLEHQYPSMGCNIKWK